MHGMRMARARAARGVLPLALGLPALAEALKPPGRWCPGAVPNAGGSDPCPALQYSVRTPWSLHSYALPLPRTTAYIDRAGMPNRCLRLPPPQPRRSLTHVAPSGGGSWVCTAGLLPSGREPCARARARVRAHRFLAFASACSSRHQTGIDDLRRRAWCCRRHRCMVASPCTLPCTG